MKNKLNILYFNIFLMFLGISIVIPVLPTILYDLDLNGSDLGLLVAVFALFQMIASPFGGRFADKFGKKIIIIIGLLLFSISEFIFAVGNTFSILLLSRVLGGISAAFVMPGVNGMIGDLSTAENRARNFSYMSAVINTGFIIGPGVGGFLAEISHRMPFYFAGVLGIIALLFSIILLKEEKEVEDVDKPKVKEPFPYKLFVVPVVVMLILSYGLSSTETMFSLYTAEKVGFEPKDISIAITGGAIVGVIFQLFLFERIVGRIGEIRLTLFSLIYSVIVLFAFIFASSYLSVMLVSFIIFIGFDLIRPSMTNYFSKLAGKNQGTAGGLNSAATSVGNLVGPLVAGVVFDIDINFPMYVAIGFFVFAAVILVFYRPDKLKF
ncbi:MULTISPECIES: multidrug efflux MFS transporter NorA [Mammaliicoccus]|jgi:DHA1 family quinolone resistance protein-like MFS transporter|uniref:Quinolone resistance protein NorA n=1 Tax=Mammaliicoccus lentus TaxID=42858 RepID=A0ABS6GY42_MAMLE|nr:MULTISPECIES: multidrug efflux MFS transporter NorA [Mammaliicoccus]ATZ72036.1 MFS transporter [Mammaliicoccus lentus]ATZ72055.1 MFS transporter [Mammaliicoccus lentus]MBF0748635.1 multidrug efflux MFS transporter NorA [Mammaliicoccus lentus]MBF0795497.1 multidrug efflux MFS transporter NorA [Mammaliicoccus lentus]MBF0842139.1 multidrug efflux MFS transporter NorA [Mammaliicoccus lentus]